MDTQTALTVASRAARKAGAVARERLGKLGYIKWKGLRDPMPEAALAVQEVLCAEIEAAFPGAAILAKEGPDDALMPVDAPELWIVDPLCGAMNFAQGIPWFALSVALRAQGNIQLGVVYDPCRDELFSASLDTPATLNGERIFVQQISEGQEAWTASIVGTDWPHSGETRDRTRMILGLMLDQVNGLSLMGSPALGLCHVAAGRLHAYWHMDLTIWDVAAPSVILQRAGGVLTDINGNSWLHSEGGYIASNGVIHGWLLNCIQSVLQFSASTETKLRNLENLPD
jgi:myo-inositol-1(or 4)-monophosphatase